MQLTIDLKINFDDNKISFEKSLLIPLFIILHFNMIKK